MLRKNGGPVQVHFLGPGDPLGQRAIVGLQCVLELPGLLLQVAQVVPAVGPARIGLQGLRVCSQCFGMATRPQGAGGRVSERVGARGCVGHLGPDSHTARTRQ